MPVENEEQVTFLVDNQFVLFAGHGNVLVLMNHGFELDFSMVHDFVKCVKLRIP